MAPSDRLVAVCNACLRPRVDVSQEWMRGAAAGQRRSTCCASDDFAFVALGSAVSESDCAACRNSSAVILVDDETALVIARHIARR
jgi:hypothetical protein